MTTDGQAQDKTVKVLKGDIGVIVVAPHGYMEDENEGDDDFTAIIAETIQKELNCYAVINEKYQRDVVNCNDINSIKATPEAEKEFLQPIIDHAVEIVERGFFTTQILIHGIEEENIKTVADEGFDILLGKGQIDGSENLRYRRLTIESYDSDEIISCLDRSGFNAILAPTDSNYCGHDKDNVNQLFKATRHKAPVEALSLQLEIKKKDFREDADQAKKTGVKIARALNEYLERIWAFRVSNQLLDGGDNFWTALSKNCIETKIEVSEIDFEDRQFMSRLDTDSPESLKDLVKSIAQHGIINNMVLRKIGTRNKLQIISGFRRLTAMREVFRKAGKLDEFQDANVPARVYYAISDDDAYEVSFTENLARKDLSLWEMSRSCRKIADDLKPKGMSKAEIDDHLAKLVKKDPRTIRRYLRVGSIQNQDLINAIHAGQLDITGAGLFARKAFTEKDRTVLYAYYKRKPMPSRVLEVVVANLIALREWSGLSATEILNHPNASEILKIDPKELESRVKEVQKGTDRTVIEILTNEIKALKKPKQPVEDKIKLDALPIMPKLMKLETALLQRGHKEASDRFQFHSKKRQTYEAAQKKLATVLEDKAKIEGGASDEDGKVSGFYEWTKPGNIVNICFGCQNDCIYCFNKAPAYRRGWVEPGKWSNETIRQDQIDANRGLFSGRVAFPTTHDITLNNLEGYITVLGKLLRAGNEILIVSKPRLDCIKRICDTSAFFKGEILFRFTIGAMDDKILSFWEPNAPSFEERKQCLEYAKKEGFNTSVSVEPMLDSENVVAMVDDLKPYVTQDIWIGKMNHTNEFAKKATGQLKEEVARVEAGQTDERLKALHEAFKGDKRVKWKTGSSPEDLEKQEAGNGEIVSVFPMAKEVDYKWPKINIKRDIGSEVQATAPIIVSASRRTEVPGHHYYSSWFMERLRRGYLATKYRQLRYITFVNTRLIVFWTKNAEPMIPHLKEIDNMGIGYYFQHTLNDYANDGIEPNIPSLHKRVETFKRLSDKIGKEKVVWRFDPLVLTDKITPEILVDRITALMEAVNGHTEKLVISFLQASKHIKVERNLKKAGIDYRDFSDDDKVYIAKHIMDLGKKYHIELATCAEEMDLTQYSISRNKCIDDGLIRRVFSGDDTLMDFIDDGRMKDKNQRPLCGCLPSVDVGTPNTCTYLCPYCYAMDSVKAVRDNLKRVSKTGELLVRDSSG